MSKRFAYRTKLAWLALGLGLLFTWGGALYWSESVIKPTRREEARSILEKSKTSRYFEHQVAGDYLTACINILTHWTFSIEPRRDQKELQNRCLKIANSQLTFDIASSEAAIVRGLSQWLDEDFEGAVQSVLASQRLAPRDLWSAIQRIELLLKVVPQEQLGTFQEYFASEFSLLTNTNNGVRTAVALYTQYPILRPALLSIADEMDSLDRLRFLNLIKRQARG